MDDLAAYHPHGDDRAPADVDGRRGGVRPGARRLRVVGDLAGSRAVIGEPGDVWSGDLWSVDVWSGDVGSGPVG